MNVNPNSYDLWSERVSINKYVGRCTEIPNIIRSGGSHEEAEQSVRDAISDMAIRGEKLPPPISKSVDRLFI